jgi:NAD/NADP transhydrogenase alpha subunit
VIDAAAQFGRAFPMMMTAAGTVPAAKVFIMGVGVAGLQAIATARRLGAIVSATDVRKATEEQVKSLGAKFVYRRYRRCRRPPQAMPSRTDGRRQGQAGGARRRAM